MAAIDIPVTGSHAEDAHGDPDANYLKAKGVAGARITTISYGKDRPVALGSNEDAWAQNRNAITSVK